ncbi:DUF4426 domain-containing protein [Litorilituus sediminis]|uniref:DUF4426 domain-containing protein n=1 Tax=Litorilituus sediminis TaxID=718192 RepID=A0A4P6PCK0_9GAMM|nr:DUF4426 domain-containing protein [Litorilituus sediminis]QBG37485.1 DUF4426 domain-containing protein [Litorilituus sediminis]
MKVLMKACLTLFVSLLLLSTVNAENMKKLGSMNVHYMAIGSTFFTPEIAKVYGITRSRYNGLVNISVLDNSKSGTPAKSVSITGTAKNNLGQMKPLEFKEVKEGSAIYYLAQISYNNEETVHFNLTINDGKEQQQLKFSQTFYVD